MVRIEELTGEDITKATAEDLYKYRLTFCQVFQKRAREGKDTGLMLPGYAFLTREMRERRLIWKAQEIDIALFGARLDIKPPNEAEEVDSDVPGEVEKQEMDVSIISKSDDDDERIVFGIVYEPDVEDTQGDQATAEEIRKAAYSFMENGQIYKVMHKGIAVEICVLETYLAPVEFQIGGEMIKKGTWVLGSRIPKGELWADIKSGDYTGYSMGGTHGERE